MRYIRGLSAETLKLLKRIYQSSQYYQVRQRAHCIQLSYQGYTIKELMKIFQVSRNTIYNWFNNWEERGLVGLYNSPGQGRKPSFNTSQKEQIKAWVKEKPKQLGWAQRKIQEEWEISVSTKTIKRVIKEARMGWYRIRRRLGGSPDPEEYARKVKDLEKLRAQERKGEIEIRYVDETGFCLMPYVPYAWQEVGQKIQVKSQRSKRLNVLGFLTRKNELEAYVFQGSITKEVVTTCIDKFCESLKQKTVLVMDNSSVHQNHLFWEKQEFWASQGLEIFFLPTYSPQLNIIEILWRFIKYQWLESKDYESFSSLVEAIEDIIKNFGSKYTINFV